MGDPNTPQRLMNACPSCGEVIDVSDCAPYSKVLCPSCSTAIRVRGDFLNFQIKQKIGEGGMSRVFRAIDKTLGREVALKILNPDFSEDSKRTEEFEREAKITAAISHPHVVKVYSAGRDQDHYFIAMELVSGGSLDEKILREGRIPEALVLDLAAEVVPGLNAAHEAGLIHRDMKPGNVLFASDGTSKIVDFGLALMLAQADADQGEIWATPYYVPPEKLYKEPEDFRSDIYSLGATLFHALAGKPPYSADTSSIEELKAIKDKPISLATIAPHVTMPTCELVDRMMARRPEDRYSSYEELLEHVNFTRREVSERGGGSVPTARLVTRQRMEETKARTAALTLLGVVVVVLGAILAFKVMGRSGDVAGDGNGGGGTDPGGGIVLAEGERSTTERFEKARQLLLAQRFGPARRAFGEIASASGTLQPTANWARFNEGLSALFAGELEGADEAFAALGQSAPFSSEERDQELVEFFSRSSGTLGGPLPVPLGEGSAFDTDSVEALVLLASGLKNWELGAFDAAESYLLAFLEAKPSKAEWVTEFRQLLDPYLQDIEILGQFPDFSRGASYAESRAVLEKSRQVSGQLQMKGLKARISKRIARFERLVERLKVEEQEKEASRMAQMKARESRIRAELKLQLAPLRSMETVSEGIALLEEAPLEHPEFKQEYEDDLVLWRGAKLFVETLISDINRFGYQGPVEQTGGSIRAMKVVAADPERLTYEFGAARGEAKIPLSQITDMTLLEMANQLSRNFSEGIDFQSRRERRALFALLVGDVAAVLAVDATLAEGEVEVREEFRGLWKRLRTR